MNQNNKELLIKFMDEMSKSHQALRYIGQCCATLMHFLECVEKPGRREYLRYIKKYAILYAQEEKCRFNRRCIYDFLCFIGAGFKPYKKKKVEGGLEKLSVISEKNQEKISEFALWLPNQYDYSNRSLELFMTGVKLFFKYCNEFNQDNVRRFIATLEERGLKPRTINARITALTTFGTFVGKDIKIKRPKIVRSLNTDNIPTEAEYTKICEWLKETGRMQYYLIVRILATSGCRLSELVQLKWADIINGEVTLKCKGNKYRRLYFPKYLQKEAQAHLSDRIKADDYVTASRLGGKLSDRSINTALKVYGKKCGINKAKMHCHAFRHFFAKKFLAKNKNDISALADLMGHGSIETTRIYTQKSYDEQKRDYHKAVTW